MRDAALISAIALMFAQMPAMARRRRARQMMELPPAAWLTDWRASVKKDQAAYTVKRT